MFDQYTYSDVIVEADRLQKEAAQESAAVAIDPATADWERSQPQYAHCTEEQIGMLFRLRGAIRTALASPLGLTAARKAAK